MRIRSQPVRLFALAVIYSSPHAATLAQEGRDTRAQLEEVLVTARRMEERLQDVPMSITALSGEALDDKGIKDINSLNMVVPGLSIVPANSPATPILNIRGLGNFNPRGGSDAAVGFYINEVPINLQIGANISLYDLEDIQVLKGPQGTLFGRNTTGGAILVNSKRPSTDGVEGYIQAGGTFFEEGDGWQSEGAVNLPIGETFAVRLSMSVQDRDGWIKNIIDPTLGPAVYGYPWAFGQTDFDNLAGIESQAYRASLLWNVTPTIENLTVISYGEFESSPNVPRPGELNPNGPIAALWPLFGVPDQVAAVQQSHSNDYWWNTMAVADNPLKVEDLTVSNTTTWEINENLTLKNIIGYKDVDEKYGQDITGLPGPWYNYGVKDGGDNFSEELQLQGVSFGGNLTWVAGLFHFEEEYSDHSVATPVSFGGPGGLLFFDSESDSNSVFAQGTLQIPSIEGLSVTLGARYTWDKKKATDRRTANPTTCLFPGLPLENCLLAGSKTFTEATYTFSAEYKWDRDSLVYFTTRRGYRAGGFSPIASNSEGFEPFKPENLTDYEVGIKKDWNLAGSPLRTNVAVFYQEYDDIQRLVVDPTDFTNQFIVNAATATVEGAEVNLLWEPTSNLSIDYSYAWVDPEYDEFVDPSGNDLEGQTFAFAPHHTHDLSVSYVLPLDPQIGEITLRAQYHHQNTMFLDDIKQSTQFGPQKSLVAKGYDMLDLGIGIEGIAGSNIDLDLFVKNATDEKIASPGAPIWDTLGMDLHFYNVPPRMYGFNLRYNFGEKK